MRASANLQPIISLKHDVTECEGVNLGEDLARRALCALLVPLQWTSIFLRVTIFYWSKFLAGISWKKLFMYWWYIQLVTCFGLKVLSILIICHFWLHVICFNCISKALFHHCWYCSTWQFRVCGVLEPELFRFFLQKIRLLYPFAKEWYLYFHSLCFICHKKLCIFLPKKEKKLGWLVWYDGII